MCIQKYCDQEHLLTRAERRRKDAGITLDRGWYMKDNEWTQSGVGAEVEGEESEYCEHIKG